MRNQVYDGWKEYKQRVKIIFDKKAKPRSFKEGDLVILWAKRYEDLGKHGMFDNLWLGPFVIEEACGQLPNSFPLDNLEGDLLEFPVNCRHLKHFIALEEESFKRCALYCTIVA